MGKVAESNVFSEEENVYVGRTLRRFFLNESFISRVKAFFPKGMGNSLLLGGRTFGFVFVYREKSRERVCNSTPRIIQYYQILNKSSK